MIKFENVAATLFLAKEVNDDMIVEELIIDKIHSLIHVQGYEVAADGTRYQVNYSITIVDISSESEQESLEPIVIRT